jgi:hypothetical protein
MEHIGLDITVAEKGATKSYILKQAEHGRIHDKGDGRHCKCAVAHILCSVAPMIKEFTKNHDKE